MLNGVHQVSFNTDAWRVVGSTRRFLVHLIVRSKAFAASAKRLTTACRAIHCVQEGRSRLQRAALGSPPQEFWCGP